MWLNLAYTCKLNVSSKSRQFKGYGQLVTVDDAEENEWLRQKFTDNFSGNSIWLSANDRRNEGQWYWQTHCPVIGYKNWSPGEPDNKGGNQNCMYLRYSDGKWDDWSCSKKLHFACEVILLRWG